MQGWLEDRLGEVEWVRVVVAMATLALVTEKIDLGVDFEFLFELSVFKVFVVIGTTLSATRLHIPSALATLVLALCMYPWISKGNGTVSKISPDLNVSDDLAMLPNARAQRTPPTRRSRVDGRIFASERADQAAAATLSMPRPPPPPPLQHALRASTRTLPGLPSKPFF